MSRKRDDHIMSQAFKLAESGEYNGWWEIEVELRGQGFSRARYLLDDSRIRERLDQMCVSAQKITTDKH